MATFLLTQNQALEALNPEAAAAKTLSRGKVGNIINVTQSDVTRTTLAGNNGEGLPWLNRQIATANREAGIKDAVAFSQYVCVKDGEGIRDPKTGRIDDSTRAVYLPVQGSKVVLGKLTAGTYTFASAAGERLNPVAMAEHPMVEFVPA